MVQDIFLTSFVSNVAYEVLDKCLSCFVGNKAEEHTNYEGDKIMDIPHYKAERQLWYEIRHFEAEPYPKAHPSGL